jgi:hypothetical protein
MLVVVQCLQTAKAVAAEDFDAQFGVVGAGGG